MMYLYMRVSLGKQDLDTQEHDLGKKYPRGIVYKETARSISARPKLAELLSVVKAGDTIAVAALDRLGRKTSEIVTLIEDLQRRQINVISLREGVDYSTPQGRLFTQNLIAFAEFERALISQRTKAALQAKKANGMKFLGRPRIDPEKIQQARDMRETGATLDAINKVTGISRGWLSQLLRQTKDAA